MAGSTTGWQPNKHRRQKGGAIAKRRWHRGTPQSKQGQQRPQNTRLTRSIATQTCHTCTCLASVREDCIAAPASTNPVRCCELPVKLHRLELETVSDKNGSGECLQPRRFLEIDTKNEENFAAGSHEFWSPTATSTAVVQSYPPRDEARSELFEGAHVRGRDTTRDNTECGDDVHDRSGTTSDCEDGGKILDEHALCFSTNRDDSNKSTVEGGICIHYDEAHETAEPARVLHPRESSDASQLGVMLLEAGILERVDAEGKRSGSWVYDTTIYEVLRQILENPESPLFQNERYSVGMIHLDTETRAVLNSSDATGALEANHVMLIIHINLTSETGYHFSLVILNAAHKHVHVFDTLGRWSDHSAWKLVKGCFPGINFKRRKFHLQNHTGQLVQRGASCGPWACWLAVGYAVNFADCRSKADELCVAKLQDDAVGFWRSVTF